MADAETILIVDDEDKVRRTFLDWLREGKLNCRILDASSAPQALQLAQSHEIDLAVLDWHLGAGSDGLQLLEDLVLFNPDIVAIMVTGFAHQATPLHAMRMGVRDYLDKNETLNKASFLAAITKQLERIRPAKQARRINEGLRAFREAVERVLPLVESAAALNDPVPLPQAVRSLFAFLLTATGASDGVLLARVYDPTKQPAEVVRAYHADGRPIEETLAPFARSLAGAVVSMQQPQAMDSLDASAGVEWQPFERGRRNVLAAPLDVAPGVQVVLELFDKPGTFGDDDRGLMRSAGDFAVELLRQALAERHTQRALADALKAAQQVGDSVSQSFAVPQSAPQPDVLQQLQSLSSPYGAIDSPATLRLCEAIRTLTVRYGSAAAEHCTALVERLRSLLDEVTGQTEEDRP